MKFFYFLFSVSILTANTAFSQTGEYNITSYGAVKNTGKVNTKEIQAAIDACYANGGGDVVIPEGTFISGTVHL